MYSYHFNLEIPEENFLNEAFTEYRRLGLKGDEILNRIEADFPMFDDSHITKAEKLIHKLYPMTNVPDNYKVKVEWLRFCPSVEYIEPAASWRRTQFMRENTEIICIVAHVSNCTFGVSSASQTLRIYCEISGKKTLLKEMEIALDKDIVSRNYMTSIELDETIPKNGEKIQEMFITAAVVIDGKEYTAAGETMTIINCPDPRIGMATWQMFSGLDGNFSKAFNLNDTGLISADISIEVAEFLKSTDLPYIEAEILIWPSNQSREMFRTMIRLQNDGHYRFRGPLVALKYDLELLSDAEQLRNETVPVYQWSCGSFDAEMFIWGDMAGSSCLSLYDREESIPFPVLEETVEETPEPETEPVKENIFEIIRLDKFSMFNTPGLKHDDEYGLAMNVDDTALMTSFRKETTSCIAVHAKYIILETGSRLDKLKENVKCRLYDETGRVLVEKNAFQVSDETVIVFYTGLGEFTDYKWEKGKYRIEFLFEEQCIATASFEIGDRCVDGDYDVHHIMQMIKKMSQKQAPEDALGKLMEMTGLKSIKEKIEKMKNLVEFCRKRKAAGLPAKMPVLHTCFIGNPGTGKTTVAKLMGQIYKDMGLLSKGEVVFEERKTLLGRFYDSESKSVANAVERAQGGILFIDEAYNLYVKDDPKDPGHRILENLLTELSDESKTDWMLILAGYPAEMNQMISSNPGLRSRIGEDFYFDDYTEDELMDIADIYCRKYKFILTNDARVQLRTVIRRELSMKDEQFGNGRFVNNLMDEIVTENMATRLAGVKSPTEEELLTIKAEDVPSVRKNTPSKGIEGLKEMIGLSNIKRSIESHMNFVRMMNMRIQSGLGGEMPPLHMIFTGNPGTGKTTVAAILGEIYSSIGVLSQGNVISVERSDMVGSHIGETELKVRALLNRAKGNVLFIDEAYQLYQDDNEKDFGKIALEAILTTLSKESIDMIVIMAGYSEEMEKLISMNPGIRSRFPYTFHFEDYSVDELVSIALHTVKKQNYEFTPEALDNLKLIIKREVSMKDSSFGNARFVKRLINTHILPAMADRLAKMSRKPTMQEMKSIIPADIPISDSQAATAATGGFDEQKISELLDRLDNMTGLEKVKSAIHNFVDIGRYLNSQGESITAKGTFKWSFVGNTGTGKSTIAEILAGLLHAMNLIPSDKVTEVKGEEIFNVSEYQCNTVLTNAIRKSRHGMLLIDGDAPEFRNGGYYLTTEQLKIKLSSLTAEIGSIGATVIAENSSSKQTIASSLADNGIYDFDHTFIFDDYNEGELFEILCSCMKPYRISFTAEAETIIRKFISDLCRNRDASFANARTMKHLAQTIRDAVLLRMSRQQDCSERIAQPEDVASFVWNRPSGRVGF